MGQHAYIAAGAVTQWNTLLRFRLLIVMHSCIAHGIACLYRRRRGDTVGDIRRQQSVVEGLELRESEVGGIKRCKVKKPVKVCYNF